jgi:hypothetical protein
MSTLDGIDLAECPRARRLIRKDGKLELKERTELTIYRHLEKRRS